MMHNRCLERERESLERVGATILATLATLPLCKHPTILSQNKNGIFQHKN